MKPLDRIGVIRQSLTIFICGIFGLVPMIGLLPAIVALDRGFRLRRRYAEPNPADNYRKWGMALGILSLLLNFGATVLAIVNPRTVLNLVSLAMHGVSRD